MLPAVRRRLRGVMRGVAATGAAGALVLMGTVTSSAHPGRAPVHHGNRCARTHIDVPSCGVLWGVFQPKRPVAGKSRWSAGYAHTERRIGRRLDLVKDYVDWQRGDTFPTATDRRLQHHHRTLYFSWNPVNFTTDATISYASIARGAWDRSVIRPEARRLERYHHKVFLDFGHEFDAKAHRNAGSPRQFAAAYRHIETVMRHQGVHNVIWSWVSTGFVGNRHAIRAGFPGARYVDWVGYDPYNFAYCTGSRWHSPYATFRPFYRWASHQRGMRHKPLLLSEYGSAPGPHVQHWYAKIPAALRRLPRIRALIQFSGPTITPCPVQLTASGSALAGFVHAAHAPNVLGR